jgi:4-diphosphocytidyl-2C-methyl-D-erythritol kinase
MQSCKLSLLVPPSDPTEHLKERGKEVFKRFPAIRAIKDQMYAMGAVYASMTGSGAALYGIFSERVNISKHFPGCFTWNAGI